MMEQKQKRKRIYTQPLRAEHIPEVAELEKLCFSSPWSAQSLELLTREGIGMGVVYLKDGKVVAYGGMLCVVDQGQITNIAVHPDHRRQGIGKAIVGALLKHAMDEKFEEVTLEVRKSNEPAQAMYRSMGFRAIATRPGFYTKPTEDGVIMTAYL
ncbi:MAG: ribosomal protein S18-alanine N-acetyltransferase [Clostridia bacterium]|nr:ribosomal protein S18-alanine N-acetyltransferase [Clostridia bacterium]